MVGSVGWSVGASRGTGFGGVFRRHSRRLLFVRLACQLGHLGVEFPCFVRRLPLLALGRFQPVQRLPGLHPAPGTSSRQVGPRSAPTDWALRANHRAAWAPPRHAHRSRPDSAVMTPTAGKSGGHCMRSAISTIQPRSSRATARHQTGNGRRGVGQGRGIRPCAAIVPPLQGRECRRLRHGCSRINAT